MDQGLQLLGDVDDCQCLPQSGTYTNSQENWHNHRPYQLRHVIATIQGCHYWVKQDAQGVLLLPSMSTRAHLYPIFLMTGRGYHHVSTSAKK